MIKCPAKRFLIVLLSFQALEVIAEVADELHLHCSKLPLPYWAQVYLSGKAANKGELTNGTTPKGTGHGPKPAENGCVVRSRLAGEKQ